MFAVPPNTITLPASHAAAHPVRISAACARDRSSWAHLLRYDPDQRFAALIESTGDVETWLLSWLPGQHTYFHDHVGSAGAFTIVSGVLTELVATKSTVDDVKVMREHSVLARQSRVFGPEHVHQVRNESTDPAVSIHVYRPYRAMRPVRG